MGKRKDNRITERPLGMKSRRWQVPLLLCLAMLVNIVGTGAFQPPASAETGQVKVLACKAEPPKGEACADFFVHVHNDDCYDGNGNPVCPLPEIKAHTHTPECYTTSKNHICGLEEGADAHHHDESCFEYVTTLTCGRREAASSTSAVWRRPPPSLSRLTTPQPRAP